MDDDLITVADAARLLGITPRQTRRRIEAGLLPGYPVTPRLLLTSRRAVIAAGAGRRPPGRKPHSPTPTAEESPR